MKKVYSAPVIEAMMCKVEKGFAGSATPTDLPVNPTSPSSSAGTGMGSGDANNSFGDMD